MDNTVHTRRQKFGFGSSNNEISLNIFLGHGIVTASLTAESEERISIFIIEAFNGFCGRTIPLEPIHRLQKSILRRSVAVFQAYGDPNAL